MYIRIGICACAAGIFGSTAATGPSMEADADARAGLAGVGIAHFSMDLPDIKEIAPAI